MTATRPPCSSAVTLTCAVPVSQSRTRRSTVARNLSPHARALTRLSDVTGGHCATASTVGKRVPVAEHGDFPGDHRQPGPQQPYLRDVAFQAGVDRYQLVPGLRGARGHVNVRRADRGTAGAAVQHPAARHRRRRNPHRALGAAVTVLPLFGGGVVLKSSAMHPPRELGRRTGLKTRAGIDRPRSRPKAISGPGRPWRTARRVIATETACPPYGL